MEVAQGVHRLTQGVVNFYLVEDGGRLTLVDAGAPRDWDLLVRALAALGRGLDDLEAVLLTHAHTDHTGFAERARTTTGAPYENRCIGVFVVRDGLIHEVREYMDTQYAARVAFTSASAAA